MDIKAVIIDLFGTLVPAFSRSGYIHAVQQMAELLDVPESEFRSRWLRAAADRHLGRYRDTRAHLIAISSELGGSNDERAVSAAADVVRRFTQDAIRPNLETIECLKFLRQTGFKLALCTNCAPDVPEVWSESPFQECFDTTFFSCVAGIAKPDPRVYEHLCEKLGIVSSACLYVGDGSSNELTGARTSGMHALLLRPALEDCFDPERSDVLGWQGDAIAHFVELRSYVCSRCITA